MKSKLLLLVTSVALMLGGASHAANISVSHTGCPVMNGDEQKFTKCNLISIDGDILENDWKAFRTAAFSLNGEHAIVKLNSLGGMLGDGIRIGVGINVLGYDTYVPADTMCVSACASMWLAGKIRFSATSATIGFHRPYTKTKAGKKLPSALGDKLTREYYAKIGVPKPAIDFFLSASPEEVYWLNSDLASGFKIEAVTVEVAEQQPGAFSSKPLSSRPTLGVN